MAKKYSYNSDISSNRYTGALPDFSDQLPVKSQPNKSGLRRFGSPNRRPLSSESDSQNTINFYELRKSDRTIEKIKTEEWFNNVIKKNFFLYKIIYSCQFHIIQKMDIMNP